MIRYVLTVAAMAVLAGSLAELSAAEKVAKVDAAKLPPAANKQNVTFDSDIKPLFEQSCVKCHGGDRPKGKLSLETLAGALKGSEHGKVLVPGKSAESILVHNVAQVGDPDNFMPPPGNKAKIARLTAEQVGLVRAWIDQGAK
jgi:hypothetical protein